MTAAGTAALLADDAGHLWHPYSGLAEPPRPLVVGARGVHLRLADGRELLDGMASWWAAVHGYRVPELDAAARAQLDSVAHVMFGGLTHRPAVELGRRLLSLVPPALTRVFLADSGSVAVEVAIKMAVQSWLGRGERRGRLLALSGGYHGDTLGAMSVCDPVRGMHTEFAGILPTQVFLPRPPAGLDADEDPDWCRAVGDLFDRHGPAAAGVICEPVLQGAGGMHVYPPWCLRVLRRHCDEHGLPLILDEVATGFGRTGTLFAAERAGVVADILCLGKAMTGGYLSMAATLCTEQVAQAVTAGGRVLAHGPTFMANPLAAAIAAASIDLLLAGPWAQRVAGIESALRAGLAPAAALPGVADVRVLGAVGVIQTRRPVDVPAATAAAAAHGVWLRPFADLVYAMPPYVLTGGQTEQLAAAMVAAAAAGGAA